VCRNDRRNIEFALGVKAAIYFGHVLAQQPIGSDELAVFEHERIFRRVRIISDNDEMIAEAVEPVLVHAVCGGQRIGLGAQFFIEDPKPQTLARLDLGIAPSLPQDQITALGPDVLRVGQLDELLRSLCATDPVIVKVL
jgi:hypothetical protein